MSMNMNAQISQKVRATHLSRDAYLYVRQSSLHQVFENTESTQRQYALRQQAIALGWPLDRIFVIDTDLGLSGASAMAAAKWGWSEMPDDPADRAEVKKKNDEWDDDDGESPNWIADDRWKSVPLSQVLSRLKLNVLERKGSTDEYLALCLRSCAHLRYAMKLASLDRVPESVDHALNHLRAARDALDLAQSLRESGHLDQAVIIGEFGLKLDGSKTALGEWLAPIEETLGHTMQALEAWKATFCDSPSLTVWHTIKRLSGSHWEKVKPDLIASMENYYDDQPKAEILLEEQEWDAALKLAEKNQGRYSRALATVADGVAAHRPEWVIQMSIKQAEKLIAPAKSKYYRAAADWLQRAQTTYIQCGRADEWRKYLSSLKQEYKRRPALMAELEKL